MTNIADQARSVVVERDFAFPPERLWRALTQPHLIAEWLMKNDFEPIVGHRFRLTGDWGGVLDCQVREIEPMTRLAYSWDFANDDPAYALNSIVAFTLNPTAAGSHLRMEQAGFRPDQKQALGGAVHGWNQFFDKLQEVLAR